MSTSGPPADAKKAQTAAMAELEAALKKKKTIESALVTLENSIYNFEGSYLDETAASGGNIIKVGCISSSLVHFVLVSSIYADRRLLSRLGIR
ncbi:hypothetical protein I305_04758 [Cryptococcus gattii E566]|uniref:Chromatin modification-related protein EAF6 n=2 Tax=Cryptococcus gattii TaxID=37769 RepID=E6RG79_CRYGW|nr:Hypothetical Protein CGB_N2510W [Cryptococcus gattii WM276]ADV25769.1 Hypothetical Protein CGB_N2510W [Cryptococcus gattii WM276]KIR78078.1 hypothetical protein I306_04956 [Cryptococcus gattii EJB2]KIY32604.1 hypothetical protein I305_04758 [Cryptococcus gattii E566]